MERAAVVAVRLPLGYAIYLLWMGVTFTVDDETFVIEKFTDIYTRDDLRRQLLNFIHALR